MKVRKRPLVVDAFKWLPGSGYPDEFSSLHYLAWTVGDIESPFCYLAIKTPQGVLRVKPGDWIVRGSHGEIYICKPDAFNRTYELAEPMVEQF